ncbi:helix-turn-helix domain-containing protein [Nocardia wallacei]|uniref:helix-turn-helix domain-containing protein n=1 Tax=Nocardia wallacei TaxID=480035 RepID=UPI002453C61C|nr:helix-turn-helix transcriptional regulator [Nocardia wallacei]
MKQNPTIRASGSSGGPKITPPHVPIGCIRVAVGLTLDQLIERIEDETGRRYSRGAISAVENGHRGASLGLIAALELAYGLPSGAISTHYRPRNTPTKDVAAQVHKLNDSVRPIRQDNPDAAASTTPAIPKEVEHVSP